MDDLGPLPKVHSREEITRRAAGELTDFCIQWHGKYGLSFLEELTLLQSQMATILMYALRYERHGETETPSGLEKEEN